MKRLLIYFSLLIVSPLFAFDGVIQTNTFFLQFPIPTANDLDRGYVETRTSVDDFIIQVAHSGPVKWELYIYTDQPWFYPLQYEKTHQDLLWRLSGSQEFVPLEMQKSLVKSGVGSEKVEIEFRLMMDWKTRPASYTTSLSLELKSVNSNY